MTTVNLEELDEATRNYLRLLRARGHEIFESLVAGYGHLLSDHPLTITFCSNGEFNAYASTKDGKHAVEVDFACISLADILLQYLLSNANVLPNLPIDPAACLSRSMPFSRRPAPIQADCQLEFSIDDRRFQIARVLADFWNTYLLCHELAHLACGHPSGSKFFLGESRHRENFDLDAWLFRGRYFLRSCEIDADLFAGVLVSQFIERFLTAPKASPVERAFAWFKGDPVRITALVLAGIHAVFTYVSAGRYTPHRRTVHPAPPLRSKSVGNAIISRIVAKFGVCPDRIVVARSKYMAQMLVALQAKGVFDWDKFDAEFTDSDEHIAFDTKLQRRFRRSCERWSLVPIDIWQGHA